MKRFIIDNLWVAWLSGIVVLLYNATVFSWEWWIMMVPTIILVTLVENK